MLTADRTMTLFNLRLDKDSRRELYIPTNIIGVSFCEIDSGSYSGGIRSEELSCKIRIPLDAKIESERKYLPENQYRALTDEEALSYWTLQKGSYILMADTADAGIWESGGYNFERTVTHEELKSLCQESRYAGALISVVEYADNTLRGSRAVKHWRIGGR